MGLFIYGENNYERISSTNVICKSLAETGYENFKINKEGYLFCDDVIMYGYNGILEIEDEDKDLRFVLMVDKGKVKLISTNGRV